MGYPIGSRNSSQAQAKIHLHVTMTFPDTLSLLECSLLQVLVSLLVCLALLNILLYLYCLVEYAEMVQGKSGNRRTFSKIESVRFLQNYDDFNCIFVIKLNYLLFEGSCMKLICVNYKIF